MKTAKTIERIKSKINMAETINYKKGNCAFCGEQIKLIQPMDNVEPYYDCDCEEWKEKNKDFFISSPLRTKKNNMTSLREQWKNYSDGDIADPVEFIINHLKSLKREVLEMQKWKTTDSSTVEEQAIEFGYHKALREVEQRLTNLIGE